MNRIGLMTVLMCCINVACAQSGELAQLTESGFKARIKFPYLAPDKTSNRLLKLLLNFKQCLTESQILQQLGKPDYIKIRSSVRADKALRGKNWVYVLKQTSRQAPPEKYVTVYFDSGGKVPIIYPGVPWNKHAYRGCTVPAAIIKIPPLGTKSHRQHKGSTSFPYFASTKRQKVLLRGLRSLRYCMKRKDVYRLVGRADYGVQHWDRQKGGNWVGSTWRYLIEKKTNMLHDTDKYFSVRFNKSHRIVAVNVVSVAGAKKLKYNPDACH